MPGVYLEYIKAGAGKFAFVVPVELSFQTETVSEPQGIQGLVTTSKWVKRDNWKEIKAMLKPAVEQCLKYNDSPADKIPKSHHISYGQEVSLGYLIVPNKFSNGLLSVLDPNKNCWSDDEDDEDELLGLNDSTLAPKKDHGGQFTECRPTNTAIRVCVVRKSVDTIDDARRIRKALGVRSEDVRNYFSSVNHPATEIGPAPTTAISENDPEVARGDRDSETLSRIASPIPHEDPGGSDSEIENTRRTFGDPDEIRDAARFYPQVLALEEDSSKESESDDELSLPDIEPNPPKKKPQPRARKKSQSLSPTKPKRQTPSILPATSQDGQADSEEDVTNFKTGTKKKKRKRTVAVAVVEPMRTLENSEVSFENTTGVQATEKRRKPRPGTSHGTDKTHSNAGRQSKLAPPAIDIVAPDDDRLTITNPPQPLTAAVSIIGTPTPKVLPLKGIDRKPERPKTKAAKKQTKSIQNIIAKFRTHDRLTPELFSEEDDNSTVMSVESNPKSPSSVGSDSEMPILMKMVDSGDEGIGSQTENTSQEKNAAEDAVRKPLLIRVGAPFQDSFDGTEDDKSDPEVPEVVTRTIPKEQTSPDITQITFTRHKTKSPRKRAPTRQSFRRKLQLSSNDEDSKSDSDPKPGPSKPKSPTRPKRKGSNKSPTKNSENGPSLQKIAEAIIVKTAISESSKLSSCNSDSNSSSHGSFYKSRKSVIQATPMTSATQATSVTSATQATPLTLATQVTPMTSINTTTTNDNSNSNPLQMVSGSEANVGRTETPSPILVKQAVPSPPVLPEETPMASNQLSLQTQKTEVVTSKKKKKKSKKKSIVQTAQVYLPKPPMADSQTQTNVDDLASAKEPNNNDPVIQQDAVVKVSRSIDGVSSEDEYCDLASSRRSLLESPVANSESGQTFNSLTLYHPILGDPEADTTEDEGLFSFESPSLPVLPPSQALVVYDKNKNVSSDSESCLVEQNNSSQEMENEHHSQEDNDHANSDESHNEEAISEPTSPQPGCSHWASPFSRPFTPPPPTLDTLMPPPLARPPRTPRKLFGSPATANNDDLPPRLSLATSDSQPDMELEEDNYPKPQNNFIQMRAPASPIGIQSDAGRIYNALNQPGIFKAGIKLIEKVAKAEMSVGEIENTLHKRKSRADDFEQSKALVPVGARKRTRELSPDICAIVPVKNKRHNNKFAESRNEDGATNEVAIRGSASDNESDTDSQGDPSVSFLEYLNSGGGGPPANTYEPHGDEFDLSQRSICMLNVVPQYQIKSRLYKIHSKAVRDTPVRVVLNHYKEIQDIVSAIFHGQTPSLRHDIYRKGAQAKKELRSLSVTAPFTSAQSSALTTMIYDKLIPDKTKRCEYIDYVNYVAIPEAFIRIYSRINDITFQQAELEMRFRACYAGEIDQEQRDESDMSDTGFAASSQQSLD